MCEKKYPFKSLMNAHLRTHEVKKFSCGVCHKSFSSKDKLFDHVHIHAIVKSFTSNVCQMTFSEKTLLAKHCLNHTSENTFTCEVCHKKLSSKRALDNQKNIHSAVCPYVCNICSKTFKDPGTLSRHKLLHTEEKSFKCENYFRQKSKFIRHQLTPQRKDSKHNHNNISEKSITCDVWQKISSKKM